MTTTAKECTYPLTITADYVGDWGFWEAARELLQNAIDQQTADPSCPMHWSLNEAGGEFVVGNPNCRLDPATLLLGNSGKRDDDRMIGRHGEGFKLAVIALLRMGCKVEIFNNNELWVPALREHRAYGVRTLHFDVVPDAPDGGNDGVWFCVTGDDVRANADLVRRCYVNYDRNTIIRGEAGRVYVAGLFVAQVEGFEHGYNFGPDRLQLDRDRRTVSSFDLAYETSRLWQQSSDPTERWRLLEAGAKDVEYLESHVPEKRREKFVAEFRTRYPEHVPVRNQQEIEAAQAEGRQWKLVPEPLYRLLRSAREFFRPRTAGTPRERLQKFLGKWGWLLPEEAKHELEDIINKLGPHPEE